MDRTPNTATDTVPNRPRRLPVSRETLLTFAAGFVFAGVLTAFYVAIWELRLGPNPTFDLVDLLIDYSPGAVATWAIETFGHLGKILLTASGIGLWMVLAGLIAAGVRLLTSSDNGRARLAVYSAFAYLVLTILVMLPVGIDSGTDMLMLLATATAWGLLAQWFVQPEAELQHVTGTAQRTTASPIEPPMAAPRAVGRRRLLTIASASALVLTAGSLGIWAVERNRKEAAATAAATLAAQTAVTPVPGVDAAFIAAPFTRPLVTSNEDFYKVDTETRSPVIEAIDWSLAVTGLVEKELDISYDSLLSMNSIEYHGTLQCISNEVGGKLISTALWEGVPLRSVLELAGPRDGAVDVVLVALGGYSDSIPFAKAMESEVMLAYAMNGVPLPIGHGFPVRAYIPNIYGMKNVKWMREIRVVDSDYQGYWQNRGWSDVAIVKTTSAIDLPERRNNAGYPRGPVEIGGIAFAGNRGIGAVEYRIDNQGPWLPTSLEDPLSFTTWLRWKAQMDLEPGRHNMEVRAVDSEGGAQEAIETNTHPDGAGGYHRVSIRIES